MVFIVPMRNWNNIIHSPFNFLILVFLSYLWGIETTGCVRRGLKYTAFLSYLWGIETYLSFLSSPCKVLVFIVPMRNWNFRWYRRFNQKEIVFIVPMRNWNKVCEGRTQKATIVFIVPMRNWNSISALQSSENCCVFIVPMRNWNHSYNIFLSSS